MQSVKGITVWYYKDGDKEIGPVDKVQLQQLLKDRKIDGHTLIRGVKATQWRSLAEVARKRKEKKTKAYPHSEKTVNEEKVAPHQESAEKNIPPAVPTPQNSSQSHQFQFTGSGGEYFKVWIVNIVLSVLTLGIYSAWAKVRRKQYFYGNTRVAGSSFSYLAEPMKILKGRIIVFVSFIIYSLLNQFYPVVGGALLLVLVPALPWFIIRALSFNARNSAIRNIRFNFHGPYMEAVKVFILWPLLLPFTLGIIFPYMYYRQKKFFVDNSTYGTAPFFLQVTARDYYALFLGLLLPLVISIVVGGVAGFIFPLASMLVYMVFYLYVMAYFVVKSSNLLYNSSSLSEHGFKSTMVVKEYLMIVGTNTLATIFTLGFFYPFALVRAYQYRIEHLVLASAGNLDHFVAAEQQQVSALGDEVSDFFDFDIGI